MKKDQNMLRDIRLHWVILLTATLTMVACSHQQPDIKKNQKKAALYYDDYYGKPPAQTHHQAHKRNQSSVQHHTAQKARHHRQQMLTRHDLKKNAPRKYVVKRGDTLWGIAKKFLHEPRKWPYIWHKNKKLKNPHLIYPGDVLYLEHGHYTQTATSNQSPHQAIPTEKLTPRIRIDRSGSRLGKPLSLIHISSPRD